MTNNPNRPDHAAAQPRLAVEVWDGAAAVGKFLVALFVTVAAVVVMALVPPVTPSSIAQAVVLGLGVIATYQLSPGPIGARWWASAKTVAGYLAAVLTALVPLVVTYADTGDWRTLTTAQWLVVVLAVLQAFGVRVTPNREVTGYTTDGEPVTPVASRLRALQLELEQRAAAEHDEAA